MLSASCRPTGTATKEHIARHNVANHVLAPSANPDVGYAQLGRHGASCAARRKLQRVDTVPFDPRKPFDPSGIRIGTLRATTRGMGEKEMERIPSWIEEGIDTATREDEPTMERIAADVRELALGFRSRAQSFSAKGGGSRRRDATR
ncbi:MAG: glycine hydroxymethyltransferase [Solirubrobacteraceae bacterium]|jgi:glycine/serine hydroxymethyltransferase|nr:glycine hydroxymethyltransferase [Solirubrobacteraceae bacterium]